MNTNKFLYYPVTDEANKDQIITAGNLNPRIKEITLMDSFECALDYLDS
jgi:hypothetical protein